MNKEEPFRDQAEKLRQKIEKIKDQSEIEIKFPSRTDVHKHKNQKKTKMKLKFPIIRLLALFFILLPIVIFSVYSYLGQESIGNSEKVSQNKNGFEEIELEENKKNKEVQSISMENKASVEVNNKKENNDVNQDANIVKEEKKSINSTKQDKNVSTNNKTVEQPKVEQPKVEQPKVEQPKVEQPKVEQPKEINYHTVQANETLYRISMKYYHNKAGIEIIKEANNIQGYEIHVGQVLKIPKY